MVMVNGILPHGTSQEVQDQVAAELAACFREIAQISERPYVLRVNLSLMEKPTSAPVTVQVSASEGSDLLGQYEDKIKAAVEVGLGITPEDEMNTAVSGEIHR